MSEEQGIPPDEIIEAAHAAGFTVSKEQLRRWRDRGLIPRSTRRWLGRGEGTTSFYPRDTEKQVIALCRILKQDRRLDLALIALFFQGYPVSLQAVRENLRKTSRQWENDFVGMIGLDGLTEKGLLEIEKISSKRRISQPGFAGARKRLRISKFESFVRILFFVAAGVRPDTLWNSPEPDVEIKILRTGLSMDKKWRSNPKLSAIASRVKEKIWTDSSDEELRESVSTFADHFSPSRVRKSLDNTTDDELIRSRDKFIRICKLITPVSKFLNKLLRKDAFGLGVLGEIDLEQPDPMVPGLLLGWLQVRHIAETPSNIPIMLDTESKSADLEHLLQEHPDAIEQISSALMETKIKG